MMSKAVNLIQLASIPVRIILSTGFSGDDTEATLCCPICGFDFIHIGAVEVEQGHVKVISKKDHVEVSHSNRHQTYRGSQVTIKFFCESGHEFAYQFAFHKGNTSIKLAGKLLDPHDFGNGGTLWRD